MTLPVLTVKQFGERRWQERVQFSADSLLAIEQINQQLGVNSAGIQRALQYWKDKRRVGRVRLRDFEWEPNADVSTSLIDVSSDNPFDYSFVAHNLKFFNWMMGKRLADFPYREIVDACGAEYYSCKDAAEPVGHHIAHDLDGFKRDYLRLLLPLTDRSGRVTALACVSRHLDSPTPAESLPSTPAC